MCQRCAASREMVALDGTHPLGRVRDHRIGSGSFILASFNSRLLSFHVKAYRVNEADPPRDLRLNVG